MDEADVARWFAAIFVGKWVELPGDSIPPTEVLEDSKEWATVLLEDPFNPHKHARHLKQRMLLGLETSPDKLILAFEDKATNSQITTYETLQQFVITRGVSPGPELNVKSRRDALLTLQSDSVPILSNEARTVVKETIEASFEIVAPVELGGDAPIVLSYSSVAINAITNWFDRVNLIWFEDKLYLNFYKTYPGVAMLIFKPGLDWYPQFLRIKLGVER